MLHKSLVSVIIPLYNAEAYIAQCINSVIAQTWPNIEIIIIDDGSTDNSFEIAKAFVNKNIKLLQQVNKGASAARNLGLKEAKGDYIQFLDADDIISGNKLTAQAELLDKNIDFIAVCDTVYFDDGTDYTQLKPIKEWYSYETNDPVNFLVKLYGGGLIGENYGGMVQPNAWLTPRSVINKAGNWNENLTVDDDGEFFCRVILESKGICYANGAVNYYRKFNTRQTLSARKNLEASKSKLTVTDLKTKHLLARSADANVKLALSRLYLENAFEFYPEFKNLSAEAEQKAKTLSPHTLFTPFPNGIKKTISYFTGWKAVRFLQFILR